MPDTVNNPSMETAELRVIEDKKRKYFQLSDGDATYRSTFLPLSLNFSGGHVIVKREDKTLADFDICTAGHAWNSTISYLDGLVGEFDSVRVVGTSELQAKDLKAGDTVTLTMPEGKIADWLNGIKATVVTHSKSHGVRSSDDWGFMPNKP